MYEELQQWIDESRRIVFFGGAGVSTESGIPDFRSQDGLYHQQFAYPPEEILSHTFFARHPEEFFRFYRAKMLPLDAQPNDAHRFLAQLEAGGRLTAVITQNIDGLHQKAGSKTVLELHGSIHRNYCLKCARFFPPEYIRDSEGVPKCPCGGIIKPDVVLYEEGLDDATVRAAVRQLQQAELLIVAGTSLTVYPAASLLRFFRGRHIVLINRGETASSGIGAHILPELCGCARHGGVRGAVLRRRSVRTARCALGADTGGRIAVYRHDFGHGAHHRLQNGGGGHRLRDGSALPRECRDSGRSVRAGSDGAGTGDVLGERHIPPQADSPADAGE